MQYLCPNYMDKPQETDKDTFLTLMLRKRPEYAIVWDVHGKDIIEFLSRVWVVQYVVIKGDTVYFSQSRHYANRARILFNLQKIVQVQSNEEWEKYLPEEAQFKRIKFWAPGVVEQPMEIDMEDFIQKMLKIRPPYAVLWNVTFEEVAQISSRVYVVSYMPIIGDTIYYSYAKYFAYQAQKRFGIPNRKEIHIQSGPEIQ